MADRERHSGAARHQNADQDRHQLDDDRVGERPQDQAGEVEAAEQRHDLISEDQPDDGGDDGDGG